MSGFIVPEGYFHGERQRRISYKAHIHWPTFWLGANSFGRFELYYPNIVARMFPEVVPPPSEQDIFELLCEYHLNYMLFIWEHHGTMWGQWVIPDGFAEVLPRHKLAADKRSPEAPSAPLNKFKSDYIKWKTNGFPPLEHRFPKYFGNISETFRKYFSASPRGSGSGTGSGSGSGSGSGTVNGEGKGIPRSSQKSGKSGSKAQSSSSPQKEKEKVPQKEKETTVAPDDWTVDERW